MPDTTHPVDEAPSDRAQLLLRTLHPVQRLAGGQGALHQGVGAKDDDARAVVGPHFLQGLAHIAQGSLPSFR